MENGSLNNNIEARKDATDSAKKEVSGMESGVSGWAFTLMSEIQGKITALETQLKAKNEETARLGRDLAQTQEQIRCLRDERVVETERWDQERKRLEGVVRTKDSEMERLREELKMLRDTVEKKDAETKETKKIKVESGEDSTGSRPAKIRRLDGEKSQLLPAESTDQVNGNQLNLDQVSLKDLFSTPESENMFIFADEQTPSDWQTEFAKSVSAAKNNGHLMTELLAAVKSLSEKVSESSAATSHVSDKLDRMNERLVRHGGDVPVAGPNRDAYKALLERLPAKTYEDLAEMFDDSAFRQEAWNYLMQFMVRDEALVRNLLALFVTDDILVTAFWPSREAKNTRAGARPLPAGFVDFVAQFCSRVIVPGIDLKETWLKKARKYVTRAGQRKKLKDSRDTKKAERLSLGLDGGMTYLPLWQKEEGHKDYN